MYGNLVQVCLCSWDTKMEMPAGNSFAHPLRKGLLQKLTGRGWLYSGTWKSRYCVLDGSKFYFYENEHSKGSEKSCGVLNLDYYDVCEESPNKDKKNQHVFIIGTSVRGFFDNRHQFAVESADDMQSWILAIQSAIKEARANRRKPGRKRHLEGKSPDLSLSSQESEGTSTACLVNATKDRAKGPSGRRLPNRKSMMPTSRPTEDSDTRQRSISLSTPPKSETIPEEESSPPTSKGVKWLSASLEEVDREKGEMEEDHRSSSVFDVSQEEPRPPFKKIGGRPGTLLGQHAALTKELEMRLKAGLAPGHHRMTRPEPEEEDDLPEKKMELLASRVDTARDTLLALEDRVAHLTKKVEATDHKSEATAAKVGDVLLQVTVTLQEAERINAECKRALIEANKAKSEYQALAKECKETLAKLNGDSPLQQNGA